MNMNMNDTKPIPPVLVPAHLTNPLAGTYIPSRDNPQHNVRPGADDHKKFKSLEDKGTAAVYRRHHV